jgi:molybdate transport system permease protein
VATREGAWQGHIAGASLRHGDRYVAVEIAGVTFDIAAEDAPETQSGDLRFAIDANGVLAWPAHAS